jgi:hypothetical protein
MGITAMPMNNDDFKSTINSLRNVDFENPEARFRALELSLIQTANCAENSHKQQIETNQKVSELIQAINKNTTNIAGIAATIRALNRVIYATFGTIVLGGIGILADKLFNLF